MNAPYPLIAAYRTGTSGTEPSALDLLLCANAGNPHAPMVLRYVVWRERQRERTRNTHCGPRICSECGAAFTPPSGEYARCFACRQAGRLQVRACRECGATFTEARSWNAIRCQKCRSTRIVDRRDDEPGNDDGDPADNWKRGRP